MSIANVFTVILIYALILSILIIDKDVLYHVYILSVLYEKKKWLIINIIFIKFMNSKLLFMTWN